MKTCCTCKIDKSDIDFYSKGRENRTSSMCKSCFNKYCIARWIARKLRVIEQFGNKCKDCNITYHPNVYEFHHINPEIKDFDWTKMRLYSEKRMQAELSKCVMLCANCHRLRHVLSS